MSANEDMTPQEAAQVMRRWADAVETVTSAAADHRAEQLEQELSRERALGEAANGERNTVGEAMLRFRHERDEFRTRAESAEARVEELEAMRGTSGLRSISGEVARLSEELADARSQRDAARAERDELDEALGKSAARVLEIRQERDDARAERDRLRAATPRTTRPDDVQTGQSVAWFSVEDMQWRVKRIKSGPDAVCFSISQMFNPHQKVVVLGEPPRELDQNEGGDEVGGDDSAHRPALDGPLPDEAGAVIEVVEFNRAPMTPQLARKLGRHAGRPFWWSLVSGDNWPDGSEVADPEEITRWRWPAEGGDDR